MKKTYLKPERTITLTSFNRHILAGGSGGAKGITFNNDGTGSIETQDGDAEGAAMSRSFNAWDED